MQAALAGLSTQLMKALILSWHNTSGTHQPVLVERLSSLSLSKGWREIQITAKTEQVQASEQ